MMHTTNYSNHFIEIAEDSPIKQGEVPPQKGEKKTVAHLQFEKLIEQPYQYTSDDVLFNVFAERKGFTQAEMADQRDHFFSKGQACFRASPLTKKYGWGVHSNQEGKIAIYPADSKEYQSFLKDESIKKVKAMRSKRA